MFSESNLHEIQFRGMTPEQIEEQLKRFETGFTPLNIVAPAILDQGIKHFDDEEIADFAKLYDKKRKKKSIVKFVPASGAASRMFKMLYGLMNDYDGSDESYKKIFSDSGLYSAKNFIENIDSFAFYDELKIVLAKHGYNINELLEKKDYKPILEHILTDKGLNYGNLPKGLILFHQYEDGNRTPLEEHLVEGALYAQNRSNDVNLHFTVSPEFMENFKTKVAEVKSKYQAKYKTKFYIDYSIQKPTTDTIAANSDNTPFLNKDNTLLFRPAGHGALIENLNELNYDIIFIKNIDNIVPDDYKDTTILYKKALAGILIQYQSTLFKLYKKVKYCRHLSDKRLRKAIDFLENELNYILPEGFETWARNDCKDYLLDILHRPIRVCGMVKNEGEPGGGPFFVQEKDGSQTLQIIEKAQIDSKSKEQQEKFNASTHFNPVDIVCGVMDSSDKKYDLKKFVDNEAGIITSKSKDGKTLKALELPGLWNGAMSNWNTIFVEVPSITFNPVKEVNDLLRNEHQSKK